MDKIDLALKKIFKSTTLTKRQKILNAEKMLTEKLDIETTNSELYFKLAVVVLEEPEIDFIKSIECMEKIIFLIKPTKRQLYFCRGFNISIGDM